MWIITDGAVKTPGIGATLYLTRNNKLQLAVFFSAKLRGRQVTWLPCEIETLFIAAATKHFSPYIIQSKTPACILTDSKPCVQSFEKLCRGEFSSSPRVATFLSTVSRYQASVRRVAGAAILPSDCASRNAPECDNPTCQVCSFVQSTKDSTVLRSSVQSILSGTAKLPFTSRAAWVALQAECSDLRRTYAHLTQATRPSKKLTNIKDVKRHLNVATIASEVPTRECIIVPRQVLCTTRLPQPPTDGHPTISLCPRYGQCRCVTTSYHHCALLRTAPTTVVKQLTNLPPKTVGINPPS